MWKGSAKIVLLEAHPARRVAPLLGRVAEELRRAAAPLAAPLVGRLHDAGRLQRAAEARLVQLAVEQQLVESPAARSA